MQPDAIDKCPLNTLHLFNAKAAPLEVVSDIFRPYTFLEIPGPATIHTSTLMAGSYESTVIHKCRISIFLILVRIFVKPSDRLMYYMCDHNSDMWYTIKTRIPCYYNGPYLAYYSSTRINAFAKTIPF